jgi:KUP system potassium uptake protein
MATLAIITIADDDDDDVRSIKPERAGRTSLGGVYNARSFSRPRKASQDGRSEETGDVEDGNDEYLRDDKKKQVFKGTTLLW